MSGDAILSTKKSIAAEYIASAISISPTVFQLAQDDVRDIPLHDLEARIASDPEFSMRVLSLANSAFYSRLHDVASLRSALVVLGAETIGKLAASLLSRSLLGTRPESDQSIWRHAQATGIAAQMIAEAHKQADPQQAFVAGLLHDIGVSAILAFGDSPADLELHAEVGAESAELLGLAPCLVSAIACHDSKKITAEAPALNTTIFAANLIANQAGYGHDAESMSGDCTLQSALDVLGLEDVDIDAFIIELTRGLESFETELGSQG